METHRRAMSRGDLTALQIVAAYSKRFTIEERFRDTKDPRFGMGLSATHVGRTDRRDRLMLVGALAQALLTLLGAASEEVGWTENSRPTPSSTAPSRSLTKDGFGIRQFPPCASSGSDRQWKRSLAAGRMSRDFRANMRGWLRLRRSSPRSLARRGPGAAERAISSSAKPAASPAWRLLIACASSTGSAQSCC